MIIQQKLKNIPIYRILVPETGKAGCLCTQDFINIYLGKIMVIETAKVECLCTQD